MNVNNISQTDYLSKISKSFGENPSVQAAPPLQTKQDTVELSTKNDTQESNNLKKILLAVGGLAVIAGGIYLAKGKFRKTSSQPIAPNTPNLSPELEKLKSKDFLSLADFKKVGSFKDGEALIDGKGFTGTIEICKEKGTRQIYKNGVLHESFRNGERRIYNYADDLKLSYIYVPVNDANIHHKIIRVNADGSKSIISRFHKVQEVNKENMRIEYFGTEKMLQKDGTVREFMAGNAQVTTGINNAGMNGRKYAIKRDMKTGKIFSSERNPYRYDADVSLVEDKIKGNILGYTRRRTVDANGKKITEFYDKKGKLHHVTQSTYDPKTKIVTEVQKEPTGKQFHYVYQTTNDKSRKITGADFDLVKDINGDISKAMVRGLNGGGEYCGLQGAALDKKEIIATLFGTDESKYSDFAKACIAQINAA